MLKEIDFKTVEKMWENREIGRVLYLYSDGTEANVANDDHWTDIVKHYDNGGKFAVENDITGKKFKVEIVETYRRYIEVEAEDEDAAYNDINNQIAEGIIDLLCDVKDYKYDRELFVSEIREDDDSLEVNLLKMTEEILNIIHAVLDYKKFICSQNMIKQFHVDNFDWFHETEKYYHSLDLPEGMKYHRSYLESILSYQTRSGMEKIDKMDNTKPEDLCNFEF